MRNRVRMRSDSAWPLRLASSSEQNRVGLALHLGRNVPLSAGRSHDAVIRVYDDAGNVIETHEHKGDLSDLRWNALSSTLNQMFRRCPGCDLEFLARRRVLSNPRCRSDLENPAPARTAHQ